MREHTDQYSSDDHFGFRLCKDYINRYPKIVFQSTDIYDGKVDPTLRTVEQELNFMQGKAKSFYKNKIVFYAS